METGASGNVCGECRLANLLKDTDLPGTLSDIAAESGLSLEVIREKFQCAECHSAGNWSGNDCGIRKCQSNSIIAGYAIPLKPVILSEILKMTDSPFIDRP